MEALDVRTMTYAEFVVFERNATTKHEYVKGRAYAMAGGSPEHARLAGAVVGELRAMSRGRPCAPFSSDLRIRIVATQRSTYPDVAVVCGALERAADDDDAVTNPALIVEVLSDSTEREDRGDKWAHYQRLASLREYVLVSQHTRRVEVFSRDREQAELWHYRDYGAASHAQLPSLGIALDIDAIYDNPLG